MVSKQGQCCLEGFVAPEYERNTMKKYILAGLLLLPPFYAQAAPRDTREYAIMISGIIVTTAGATKLTDKEDKEMLAGLMFCACGLALIACSEALARN